MDNNHSKDYNGITIGSLKKGQEYLEHETNKLKADQLEMIKVVSTLTEAIKTLTKTDDENRREIDNIRKDQLRDHTARILTLEKEVEQIRSAELSEHETAKINKANVLAILAIIIAAIPALVQVLGLLKKFMEFVIQ